MHTTPEHLEQLWDNLLSRQPARIRKAFASLDTTSRKSVYEHLQLMASNPGWQPGQRDSAIAALKALGDIPDQDN
jgi:hypothetical protein